MSILYPKCQLAVKFLNPAQFLKGYVVYEIGQ